MSTPDGALPGTSRAPQPLTLADRRTAWRLVARSARPYVGWVLAALGALALVLGWVGVSGQALTAKQLPYLVSGGLVGIGLLVLAAAFLAGDDVRREVARLGDLERKVDELYELLTAEPATDQWAEPVALPTGTSYHRPECTLVRGKTGAGPVGARAVARRGLTACRVCNPPPPITD